MMNVSLYLRGYIFVKDLSRRAFLKRTVAAGAAGAVTLATSKTKVFATSEKEESMGTLIDLTVCDGCKEQAFPACVQACRSKNEGRFPEPQHPIKDYWPQKKHEDWSDKRDLTTRLTPYNWTFVDQVKVEYAGEEQEIFVPRRCMHCDNPTCMNLCPFGTIKKEESGAVWIDDSFCMGGAKCRSVCPWEIPQRQAGVGLYLKVAPDLAGGGVMYKCDMCADLVAKGEEPACATACPKGAILFGTKEEMRQLAYERAKAMDGYVYGDKENGGTATFYVSKVPFEMIDDAIRKDKTSKNDTKPGRPTMPVAVENKLDTLQGMAMAAMVAPVAGAITAGVAAYRKMKGEQKDA